MVTDARGHTVPSGSDAPKRQALLDLSDSIADVRSVADQAAGQAAVADLVDAGIDPAGTVWWLASPGVLAVYTGSAFQALALKSQADALDARVPVGQAAGTVTVPSVPSGDAKNATVTFPSGVFTGAPFITLGIYTSSTAGRLATHHTKTSAGFIIRAFIVDGWSSQDVLVSWNAVRMPPPAQAMQTFSTFAAMSAPAAEPEPQATATCPTPGCPNHQAG
jgi:hypothetical protein